MTDRIMTISFCNSAGELDSATLTNPENGDVLASIITMIGNIDDASFYDGDRITFRVTEGQ